MSEPVRDRVSYAEYLALERADDVRHEYLDGRIRAMAGGTPRHAALKTNLTAQIAARLATGPCRAFDSDLKVRVAATGLATYADLTVVCGALELDAEDPNAVTNPVLVAEVLSDGTEAWDRGAKFRHYQRIPTLAHILLVRHDDPGVEHYAPQDDGSWRLTDHGLGDEVVLESLAVRLPVGPLYERVP